MSFSDIHMHILYGTDDGPKTREAMFEMVDTAYKNGIRLICATPHFHPVIFGDNRESAVHAFEVLTQYCKEQYTDLSLFLGNELFYVNEAVSWLKNGICRPAGNTRHVLVEFSVTASEDTIAENVDRLLNMGYVPIIAHAERYRKLSAGRLWVIRQNGALVQMNASSLCFKPTMFCQNNRVKNMLNKGLVDFISTDAHGVTRRPPEMKEAYDYLLKKYGKEYADNLCRDNAIKLLCHDKNLEENQ